MQPRTWCVANPRADVPTLQGAIDYCCSQPGVNCGPIQPGGSCFQPNTLIDHANYAINLFYKAHGGGRQWCPSNSGFIIFSDPSHDSCVFP
ncbi:hypothetical protein L1049_020298 [Liquidambar formosana]|uniref:X8 domain-containing protein n=1 Tax=Liquidambar formosana TaxID=63359 RepID=A0AAP0S8A1_LIQFO